MKALEGIRVLDLTHMVAGPYGAMLLADLGAETIKIEPPGEGEIARRLPADDPRHSPHGIGAYFLALNRNKRSLALDLKNPAGLEIFYELVRTADVVLSNFSVEATERLKIDYAHLAAINPRIITCTISGFGASGPSKDRTAFDMVAQGMSGMMALTGEPGGPPTRLGMPVADLAAGMMAATGILAALQARHQSGRGQQIDISMLDVQISLLSYAAAMYLLSGEIPPRLGNAHFTHVPYNVYPCQDGYLILAVITDRAWEGLMSVLDAPELNTAENLERAGRLQHRDMIDQRLGQIFLAGSQAAWVERLSAARVPCAPVYDLAQALADEQVLHRQMVVEVAHPLGGTVRLVGNPLKLSENGEDTFTPPPLLGQDSAEILGRLLGKSAAEIAALRQANVIP